MHGVWAEAAGWVVKAGATYGHPATYTGNNPQPVRRMLHRQRETQMFTEMSLIDIQPLKRSEPSSQTGVTTAKVMGGMARMFGT